jgi:Bacterial membrane protein YfhO
MKRDRTFWIVSICVAFGLTSIVYAPMFSGKIPFPADFIFDFPAFAPLIPSYRLLPQTNIGDLVTSFYPYRTIAARAIREGSLPLWNPDMLSGTPFLAMAQSALFYPASFLYYFLPVPVAWSMGFVIRRVLAAFFTALLVRRIGGTAAGAVAAGLMFAFCGFLTAWQGQSMSDAAIWLPLICYSVVRLHADVTARSIAISAFAFAMPVLAGHPETAAHLTLTGLGLALFLMIAEPKFTFIEAFIGSGLLALGLAAVQIIPTVEWLKYIHRSLQQQWPVPPLYSILGFVSRDIIRTKNVIGLLMPEHAGYLAMMTFVAVPLGFIQRSSRRFAIYFALAAAAAISAAYGIGPGHWFVSHVPGLNMLKNARLTLVAGFSLSVLAGLGISALEAMEMSQLKSARFRIGLFGSAGFAVAFLLIYATHEIPVSEVIEFVRVPRFGLLLLIAAGMTVGLRVANRLSRRLFVLLTLAVVAVDLGTVTFGAIPFTSPRDVFPPFPLFDTLPKNTTGPFRVAQAGYAYGANFEAMYGYPAIGGYEIPLERLKTFLSDLTDNKMDSVMITTKGVLDSKDRRLDMLNAKYFVVSMWDSRYLEFRNQPERFRFLSTFGDTDLYENPRALPRAFLIPASGVEVIADETDQLRRVKDPNFDAEHCVILPSAPAPESSSVPAGTAPTAPSIEWTANRPNGLELNASAVEPSVLVLSQIDYPGWKAFVDGRAVALTRANYAFPAILIPPGRHQVRFSFDPLTFKLGLALSVLAATILIVMVLRGTDRSNPHRV